MNDKPKQSEINSRYVHHHSFLLRLWRSEEAEVSGWRASLEIPFIEKRIGFTSLEQLFAFLMELSEGDGDMPKLEEKG